MSSQTRRLVTIRLTRRVLEYSISGMKAFEIAAVFAAAMASAACLWASGGTSPNRMGNQISVTFDKPRDVSLEEGVRFYPDCPDPDVKLDVYYPNEKFKGGKGPYPCVLAIHGGGWSMGNEKKFAMMSAFLASKGYVVACTTYRLRPEYSMEDCAYDAKKALWWLKKNAARFGGDPSRVGVTGGSAGGHLSALLAVSSGAGQWGEIFSGGVDDSVQAAVPMAPVTNLDTFSKWRLFAGGNGRERARALSPIAYVGPKSPPMLILHSAKDSVVPVSESENMKAAYEKAGAQCDIILYDSADHAFWNAKIYDPLRLRSWSDIADFFDKTLKK